MRADLTVSGIGAIGRGLNWQVYTRMFLNTMRPKALQKWGNILVCFHGMRARDLHDFDNVFTAPLHGFQQYNRLLGKLQPSLCCGISASLLCCSMR